MTLAEVLRVLIDQFGHGAVGDLVHGVIPAPGEVLLRHGGPFSILRPLGEEAVVVWLAGLIPAIVHDLALPHSELESLGYRKEGAESQIHQGRHEQHEAHKGRHGRSEAAGGAAAAGGDDGGDGQPWQKAEQGDEKPREGIEGWRELQNDHGDAKQHAANDDDEHETQQQAGGEHAQQSATALSGEQGQHAELSVAAEHVMTEQQQHERSQNTEHKGEIELPERLQQRIGERGFVKLLL